MTNEAPQRSEPGRPARPHWLNRRRLRAYPWLFVVAFAMIAGYWAMQSETGLDTEGKPLGYDFVSFWSASQLALEGEPEAAYQPERILAMGRRAIPGLETRFIHQTLEGIDRQLLFDPLQCHERRVSKRGDVSGGFLQGRCADGIA